MHPMFADRFAQTRLDELHAEAERARLVRKLRRLRRRDGRPSWQPRQT
jgi:hypothetical protein